MTEPRSKVIVSLTCTACQQDFIGRFPVAFAERLRAAGITTEEVAEKLRGGLLSGELMCRSCLAARVN